MVPYKKPKSKSKSNKLAKTSLRKEIIKVINSNAEKKFSDYQLSTDMTTTPFITKLNPITQGDADVGQRNVYSIRSANLQYKISVKSSDQTQYIRITIFRWRENDSVNVPTAAQLYNVFTADPRSFFNMDSLRGHMFDILKDFHIDGQGEAVNDRQKLFKGTIKLKNKTMNYAGGGTNGTNQLYICYWSDSGAINHPTLDFLSRFVYVDV